MTRNVNRRYLAYHFPRRILCTNCVSISGNRSLYAKWNIVVIHVIQVYLYSGVRMLVRRASRWGVKGTASRWMSGTRWRWRRGWGSVSSIRENPQKESERSSRWRQDFESVAIEDSAEARSRFIFCALPLDPGVVVVVVRVVGGKDLHFLMNDRTGIYMHEICGGFLLHESGVRSGPLFRSSVVRDVDEILGAINNCYSRTAHVFRWPFRVDLLMKRAWWFATHTNDSIAWTR